MDEANLTIGRGEIHCLAGENGSGKSTLIKIISGFYQADSGTVTINGESYTRITPLESIQAGIAVIYQDLSVFPNLTVAENIALSSAISDKRKVVNWKEIRRIAKEAIEVLNINLKLDDYLEELPIADRQLVAICRAITHKAQLIIMDEATTALTEKEVNTLFEVIKKLQADGISILFVSHKINEVFAISENYTIIRDGKNVFTGSAREINQKEFIQHMTGRVISEDSFVPENIDYSIPALKVEDLSLGKGFTDVSFEVYPGEILGITGPLGSGRAEVAKTIFGLFKPTSGQILINGVRQKIKAPYVARKKNIAYVPEDRVSEALFLPQAIRKNLAVSSINKMVKGLFVDESKLTEGTSRWEKELSIRLGSQYDAVSTLSGGNQQKTVLARWLNAGPNLLLLNGPTVGVDIGAKYDLHQYLRKLANDHGIAIVIISDDIPELCHNCNRILIMKRGQIVDHLQSSETNIDDLTKRIYS